MAIGSNYNNRDSVNVNTRGIQLMNADGVFQSTLQIGYWNSMLSFKIHPALEKSQRTESKIFDYDTVTNTALTLEKSIILAEQIEQVILPAIEEGIERFRSVPIGGDSLIGVGIRNCDGKMIAYLAVLKSLDETTKQPKTSSFYQFKTSYVIDDYNAETGEYKIINDVQSELKLFLEVLKAAHVGLSNAVAHSTRTVDKFFRDRLMNQLGEIATKLGISVSNGGNYNKRNDIFSSGSNSGSMGAALNRGNELPDFDAPISQLSNINDINQFMN